MVAISRRCALFLLAVGLGAPVTAHAQIPTTKPYSSLFLMRAVEVVNQQTPEPAVALIAAAAQVPLPAVDAAKPGSTSHRAAMSSLYIGLGALQGLDAHSTFKALGAGHVEQNPLIRWSTDHPVAFVSIKAAATLSTILVSERIRKKHPKRAIAFMTAINAAYAVVVAHNYATAR
jgi:hypothetical protein